MKFAGWAAGLFALLTVAAAASSASAQAGDPNDPCTPPATPPAPQEAATDYPGGLSRVGGGLTPAKVPGAVTVTPREAACLYNKNLKTLVVIDATDDDQGVPGAYSAPFAAAAGSLADDTQKLFEAKLTAVTGGDLNRPILIYCHHIRCFLSYNATLRAVNAGYVHVYWMREGIQGWVEAGLPVQPVRYFPGMEPPPAPKGPSPEAVAAMRAAAAEEIRKDMKENCDQSSRYDTASNYGVRLVQFKTLAEADAAAEKDMAEQIKYEQICFGNRRRDAAEIGDKALLAEIDTYMSNGMTRLRAAHVRGRAAFEKNPLEFMWDNNGKAPAHLRGLLKTAAGPLSLEETCGVFDTSIPPLNNPALQAFHARWDAYRVCLNTWIKDDPNVQGELGLGEIDFEQAMTMLQGIKPYRCSVWKGPNCVPDSRWDALNAVATPQNLSRIKAAHDRASNRSEVFDRQALILTQTQDAVNRAVDAYNASQQ